MFYPYTPHDVQLVGGAKNATFLHRYNYRNRATWTKLALMKGSKCVFQPTVYMWPMSENRDINRMFRMHLNFGGEVTDRRTEPIAYTPLAHAQRGVTM